MCFRMWTWKLMVCSTQHTSKVVLPNLKSLWLFIPTDKVSNYFHCTNCLIKELGTSDESNNVICMVFTVTEEEICPDRVSIFVNFWLDSKAEKISVQRKIYCWIQQLLHKNPCLKE